MTSLIRLARRYSLRSRLLFALAVECAAVLALAGFGLFSMSRLESLAAGFVHQDSARAAALSAVRDDMGMLRRHEKDMVINYEKSAEVMRHSKEWQARWRRLGEGLDRLERSVDARSVPVVRALRGHLGAYAGHFTPVARQLEKDAYDSASVVNRILGKAYDAFAQAEAQVAALDAAAKDDADASRSASAAQVAASFRAYAAVGALVLAALATFTLVNLRGICGPIERATRAAGAVARGELSHPITPDGDDEAGRLLQALRDMQQSLRGIASQIARSSQGVAVAANQIASGNVDLSDRTERAAARLEQTTSSVHEINTKLQQAAESSRQATALAAAASGVALRSRQAFDALVKTMDAVRSQSARIAEITGTIDALSSQTSILALNAAVEAARAGEQGRGFAVVAGEVRSLAQRSAAAAKEIGSLIASSVQSIDAAGAEVSGVAQTMGEVVGNVRRVEELVVAMSQGATAQGAELQKLAGSLDELDHMVQQNAALVEQCAAAAQSLDRQALDLTQAVQGLKLDE